MKLIRDIDSDRVKFALVKGMVEFSKVSNVLLIAEGIETYGELSTLVNLGVQYGQGYLIQKPDSEVLEIKQDVLQMIKEINIKKNNSSQSLISNIYIANLCTSIGSISPNEMIPNVLDIFKHNLNCFGLCVTENEIPVGIVTREKLALKLSGHYGFSLNKNKKISMLMDKGLLCVDYKTPVSIVAYMAMERESDKLYDFIVVTENDKYLGIVTIKDLLKKL
jgi:CBS domain-containing protein